MPRSPQVYALIVISSNVYIHVVDLLLKNRIGFGTGWNSQTTMSKNIDDLIRESDEALKRIESLQAKSRSVSSGKGFVERVFRHSAQNSHHLVPIALAGGLVGLSLLRYREKYAHRESMQELEDRIRELEVDVKALRDKGTKLSLAVQDSLADTNTSWWKSSSSLARQELRKALDMYHQGKTDGDFPHPVKRVDDPHPPSSGKHSRPFI